MAMVPKQLATTGIHYPDSDGKPLGESPRHIRNILYTFDVINAWFAAEPMVFVAGNMFLYYVEGQPRLNVSPDIIVARGIPRNDVPERRKFLLWEETKAPDLVIEVTSESTEEEDREDKMAIYRDILGVSEYFLFDPYAEWLDPPLQGYRLRRGKYGSIRPVEGRLPSKVLGLHLEAEDDLLRLYNPLKGQWLRTPPEERAATKREARARRLEAKARRVAEARASAAEEGRRVAEAEIERLRKENEEMRRRLPPTT